MTIRAKDLASLDSVHSTFANGDAFVSSADFVTMLFSWPTPLANESENVGIAYVGIRRIAARSVGRKGRFRPEECAYLPSKGLMKLEQ
jgi:hypothetical protein